MRFLVDILYLIALLFYSPVLLYRMLVVGKDRRDWGQRFGAIPGRQDDGPLIWIHAVSMGEANATVTLVEQLRRAMPNCRIAISATTDTGYARVGQLYPDVMRFRYPLDFSFVVRRVFSRIHPAAIVLMELEVWPNLTREARRRGVPVIVANGRLTERAMKRYRMLGLFVRPMFTRLAAVCAQDRAYADRFAALGVPGDRITVTGSVKYDTATIADTVAGQDELAAAMGLRPDHLLLNAGSTGSSEAGWRAGGAVRLAAGPKARASRMPRAIPGPQKRSSSATPWASCENSTPCPAWSSSADRSCRSAAAT